MSERAGKQVTPTLTPVPSGVLQRCSCGGKAHGECDSCRRKRQALQRSASAPEPEGRRVPAVVGAALAGSGRPLEGSVRDAMESRFGHDFGRVRIHDGALAAESARAVNAKAYTVGREVLFAEGQYAPGTSVGQRLLAHELTHVLQQGGEGGGSPAFLDPATESRYEAEADRMSAQATTGESAAVAGGAPAGLVQRAKAEGSPPAKERSKAVYVPNVATGMGRYDAWFTPPCDLTLVMRIAFKPEADPNTGANWGGKTNPTEFADWQKRFINSVQTFWKGKLKPKRRCTMGGCEELNCGVRVEAAAEKDAHAIVHVRKTTQWLQSKAGWGSATLDQLDLDSDHRAGTTVSFTAANHEFGHLMGLKHIRCPFNWDSCYGVTTIQRNDAMGAGSLMSAHDMRPWERAATAIFPACDFGFVSGAETGALIGGLALGGVGAIVGSIIGNSKGGAGGAVTGGILGGLGGGLVGAIGGGLIGDAVD